MFVVFFFFFHSLIFRDNFFLYVFVLFSPSYSLSPDFFFVPSRCPLRFCVYDDEWFLINVDQ